MINFSDLYNSLDLIEFKLPLPVSVNKSYTVSKGRIIKSGDARRWRAYAEKQLFCDFYNSRLPKLSGKIGIAHRFVFKDMRIRDSSNFIKQLHDAIVKAGLVEDDSMFFGEINVKEIDKSATENYVLFKIWSMK
jgi:Holliday junction resolvase RusA-like endonuclease